MKSIEDLNQLREKIRREMQTREQDHSVTVTVNMGTTGIAAGSRDIVKALLEELKDQGLSDVALRQTSHDGQLQFEPLVKVSKGGENTTYVKVDRDKAKEIVRKHLVAGEIIKEWTTPEK